MHCFLETDIFPPVDIVSTAAHTPIFFFAQSATDVAVAAILFTAPTPVVVPIVSYVPLVDVIASPVVFSELYHVGSQ